MKLALLRHGESQWNLENRFTGWTNVSLTKNGESEAKKAGILLNDYNIQINLAYVSYLKRAVNTYKICQKQLKNNNIEVLFDWRLNERHYGSLQGLNKAQTAKKYGNRQVLIWRRSYDTRPPSLDKNDKRHPRYDTLYKDINNKKLPSSESLKDTLNRVKPLWVNNILPQIKNGKNILIVAHGNSLRAIVKILKKITNKDIISLNIPTGVPYIFEMNENLDVKKDYFLGDQNKILKQINDVFEQGKSKN